MPGKRLAPEQRAAIANAIRAADGAKSRNQIAREHGISHGTVTGIAAEHGLTDAFDRSKTKSATAAALADSRAVRAATSRRFLDVSNRLLDRLDQPFTAFAFGGRDNVYTEHEFSLPTVDATRTIITSAAIAYDKHLAQDKHDADDDGAIDASKALLTAVLGGLAGKHGSDPPEAEPGDA